MKQLRFVSQSVLPLAILALGVMSANSQAAEGPKYGMAGCGLGSLIFAPNSMQISAATTNATFWTNPLGILSGTSNCIPTNESWAAQENFVTSNLATLSKDVAQGSGTSLAALEQLMECQPSADAEFRSTLQGAYSKIFAEPGALAVLDAIKGELNSNPQLKAQCSAI
jgi:hypothetical protein